MATAPPATRDIDIGSGSLAAAKAGSAKRHIPRATPAMVKMVFIVFSCSNNHVSCTSSKLVSVANLATTAVRSHSGEASTEQSQRDRLGNVVQRNAGNCQEQPLRLAARAPRATPAVLRTAGRLYW